MTLILVYTLSKTILGHSFFNHILVLFMKPYLYFVVAMETTLQPKKIENFFNCHCLQYHGILYTCISVITISIMVLKIG